MRDNKEVTAIICAFLVSVVVAAVLTSKPKVTPEAPVPEAPVPEEEMPSPFDYVVKVTAHNPGDSHVGVGTLVEYDGYTFVLTSKMIFTLGDTHFTVTADGEQYPARMIGIGDFGLIALEVSGEFDGLEVNEAPNVPPDASVLVWNLEETFAVNVIRYLTDPDWLMLDGSLPDTCTGSPITTSDGSLAGVVIGINTQNAKEAFAVGNHAIREFADAVVNGESQQKDVFQKSIRTRRLFRRRR